MGDKLTIRCGNCGSDKFRNADDPNPSAVITCAGCGATTTRAKLKAMAVKEAEKLIADTLKRTFGKNFKRR